MDEHSGTRGKHESRIGRRDVARKAASPKGRPKWASLLLEGRSLRIVQQELFISEGTARTHAKRIYAKLGIHSKQELIDYFKQNLPH